MLAQTDDPVCQALGNAIVSGLSHVMITAGQIYAEGQVAYGQYSPPVQATQNRWEIMIAAAWLDPANPSISTARSKSEMNKSLRHEFLHRMGIQHNSSPNTYYYSDQWCASGGGGRGQDF
jgi:hypothetical protein